MTWWLWTMVGVYAAMGGLVFWLNTDSPVTLGLAILRALLWPLWITTGIPRGQRLPMD